ncbi:MAG: hypothetical protein GX763_05805 [Clostridiaceae bacterium]|nr:hypothetical protein [Clostridiaceae bacterium]
MKRIIALVLITTILLTCLPSCGTKGSPSPNMEEATESNIDNTIHEEKESLNTWVMPPDFNDLKNDDLARYMEDSVYSNLVTELNSEDYFVQNVETVYISKEYIEEINYNSQANIFFGYTLEELDEHFLDSRYVFTLGDNGQTTVTAFEPYDDIYEKVLKNILVGSGVIMVCVTVSVATGGVAPAISMIFAVSAKTGTVAAASSGLIAGVSAGIIEGTKSKDFDKAIQAAALGGSEGFKWGAITGAISGGVGEAIALKGATLNGLTMNEAAIIQKESKYPLDIIKELKSMDQYEIFKETGLKAEQVGGKTALIRYDIDLNLQDEFGLTNLEKMRKGQAALDATGKPFELHHVGQSMDSTLAILTKAEHMQEGNNSILHTLEGGSQIDRNVFQNIRSDFWKELAKILG